MVERMRYCAYCGKTFSPPEDALPAQYCSETCQNAAEVNLRALVFLLQQTPLSASTFREWLQDGFLRGILRQMIWQQEDVEFMVCEDYTLANIESRQVYLTDAPIRRIEYPSDDWRSVLYDYGILLNTAYLNKGYGERQAWRSVAYVPLLRAGMSTKDWYTRQLIAANPHSTADILAHLAQDIETAIRETVAQNQQVPLDILPQLGRDKDFRVRYAVASQRHTPPEVLETLAHDREETVRRKVATNSWQITPAILTDLAKDTRTQVRCAVAANRLTPFEALSVLAQDSVSDVREKVARNRNATADLLRLLVRDSMLSVRRTLVKRRDLPPDILQALSQDETGTIRTHVAENPHCSAELLTAMAGDLSKFVRKRVAEHPNTPLEVVQRLTKDISPTVKDAAKLRLRQHREQNL